MVVDLSHKYCRVCVTSVMCSTCCNPVCFFLYVPLVFKPVFSINTLHIFKQYELFITLNFYIQHFLFTFNIKKKSEAQS